MLMIISIDTYALALFQLAQEQSLEKKYYHELKEFNKVLLDEEISKILKRSVADYRVFDNFWNSLEGHYSKEVINFLRIIQEASLMYALDRIIFEYRDLLEEHKLIHIVDIISAKELSKKEIDEIIAKISQRYEGELDVEYEHDPSLVGGLKIRVNNDIYDTSIKNKFKQILAQGGLRHE